MLRGILGMTKQVKADAALLFVTVGWGTSFWLTKNSISEMPTYNFLAIRFIIAFMISSLIFIKHMVKIGKKELKYGTMIGALLYSSFAFQTVGLSYTTVSKSAFITGFSVVLVPVFSAIMTKTKLNGKICISVTLALVGLAMLTLNQGIADINIGDIYTLISAVLYALYIIFVGKYTAKVESISFAIIQIGVVGLLSMVTSLFIEKPIIPTSYNIWGSIIMLSVVCTAGAFIIQNVAQKYTTATHTALIYTAEPVFAAIFAYIVSGEILSLMGFFGAVLILLGTLISEIDFKIVFNKNNIKEMPEIDV
jgi:drug/metabolite transporter (DMT)-like permease